MLSPLRLIIIPFLLLMLPLVGRADTVEAQQQMQAIQYQLITLERDLLLLDEKLSPPLLVFFSVKTDNKFKLDKINLRLDNQPLTEKIYAAPAKEALRQNGADLIFDKRIPVGQHQLIAYYTNRAGQQRGVTYDFSLGKQPQVLEVVIQPSNASENRKLPPVSIRPWSAALGEKNNITSPFLRQLLFLELTGEQAPTVTSILKNLKLGRFLDSEYRVQLILGRQYLQLGVYDRAAQAFQSLIHNPQVNQVIRNEAEFAMGKSYYQQGLFQQAEQAFNDAGDNLPDKMRAPVQHMMNLMLLQQQRYRDVIHYNKQHWWTAPGNWHLYALYNLAVAFIHSKDETDVNEGLKLLTRLARTDSNDDEAIALKDQARQTLGFIQLRQNKAAEALQTLSAIGLHGPASNRALLGTGWAYASLNRFNKSLAPWQELHQRDKRDLAVLESWLSLPYAYEKLAYLTQAANSYNTAVNGFSDELQHIRDAIAALKAQGMPEIIGWIDAQKGLTDGVYDKMDQQNKTRYLHTFSLQQADMRQTLELLARNSYLRGQIKSLSARIQALEQRYMQTASEEEKASIKTNMQHFTGGLGKRSEAQLQQLTRIADKLQHQLTQQLVARLQQRQQRLEVLLVQSRLALAQLHERLEDAR